MKLLTRKDRRDIPPLYAQDGKKGDAIVYVKYFTPYNNWTWYVLEFDGEDTFFGWVEGHESEYGYFSLSELESLRVGPMPAIEKDLYFDPKPLKNLIGERV